MIFILTFIAVASGVSIALATWHQGWLIVLVSAPLGASFITGLLALGFAALRSTASSARRDPYRDPKAARAGPVRHDL
jgi:hypothetical protein